MRWIQRKPLPAALAGTIIFLAIAGPLTAITIALQEATIQRGKNERRGLINEGVDNQQNFALSIDELKQQNDRLKGLVKPSEYWPQNPERPPYRLQLQAVNQVAGGSLTRLADDPSSKPWDAIRANLALGLQYEALNNNDEAVRRLAKAKDGLSTLVNAEPSNSIALRALAETYEDLARLDKLDAARGWHRAVRNSTTATCGASPTDAGSLAAWQDAELRSASAGGPESMKAMIDGDFSKLQKRFETALPADPMAAYRLTYELARRPALVAPPASDGSSPEAKGNPSSS